MVPVQCNSATPLRLRPSLLPPLLNSPSPHAAASAASFPKNHHLQLLRPHRLRHRRITSAAASPGSPTSEPTSNSQSQSQIRTLFPGGFKRPEIKVPTLVLRVGAEEVVEREGLRAAIDAAVARGVVGIVLLGCGVGDGAGRRLYEAACVLKSLLRERAYLVIDDRVDIAAAVRASGVLLSDQGIPAIVARNMLSNSGSDSVLLPLVARYVKNTDAALSASRSEGADFLIVDTDSEKYADVLEILTVHQDIKIPVFLDVSGSIGGDSLTTMAENLIQSGASGIVLSQHNLILFSEDVMSIIFPSDHAVNGRVSNVSMNSDNYETSNTRTINKKKMVAGFNKLGDREIRFIEKERNALLEAVAVIRKAAPMMEEVSLLVDAISRLDQPFMLVIVGEFNSGKSTVINALLGRRYLKEGVVPTTNEITLLCYSDKDDFEQERCERHPDGQFMCYLPSPLLQEMNLVDTPGTNVILQRQQRLTEEFVPRADLVLFVLSSDRPLTESEVAFLLYIRQWKKKIFFALNKSDLYRNTSELEEAMVFIKQNIQKLLNTEQVELFPLSARLGLEAKLSITSNIERDHDVWQSSGFNEFENFLYSFLDGSTDNGKERMRLKLETPIGIADRLLAASERLVNEEYALACNDLMSINILINSVNDHAKRMESDSTTWRNKISSLIETAKARSVKLIESILQLSNADLITTYAIRGEKATSTPAITAIQNEIIGPAQSDAQKLLAEYVQWLETSFSGESQSYCQSFNNRWPEFIIPQGKVTLETTVLWDKGDKLSLEVTRSFSAKAAARLIEQEIREAVLGTYGGLGVAGLSASLLTSVLPTTLEDLLALALCSTGGLLAVSNFPARRRNTIEKVIKIADALSREIEEAMREDLLQATEKFKNFVEVIGKPYQEGAQHKINRLSEIKNDIIVVEQKLDALKIEIQNLHVP